MGKGIGKGYKNMIGIDKRVHSMSAKGIKQPQRLNPLAFKDINKKFPKKLIKEFVKNIPDSQYDYEVSLNEVYDLEKGKYFTVSFAGKDKITKLFMFDTMAGVGHNFGFKDKDEAENLFYKIKRDLKAGVNPDLLKFQGSSKASIKTDNKIYKDVENMANNVMRLKETSYADEKDRDYLDKNIRSIFDSWEKKKIPKWKQNLLFDKAESLIENKNYSIKNMKSDVSDIINE